MAYTDHEHLLSGYGAKFSYSSDGGSTYTDIDDLASVEVGEDEWQESDDTTLQTTGRRIVATPGLLKQTDSTFVSYFHKTQADTLKGFFNNRTTLGWKVTLPSLSTESAPTTHAFSGWIKKWKPVTKQEKGSEDKTMVEWSIYRTTAVTQTAGTDA